MFSAFRLIACAGLLLLMAPAVNAACSNPTGDEGKIIYNADYKIPQFCNGTEWIAWGSGYQSPVDDQSGSGYIRIGDMQIAWGAYTSHGTTEPLTTFPAAFNETPTIVLTPSAAGLGRLSTLNSSSSTDFSVTTWVNGGARSSVGGNYIAVGTWR